MFIAYGRFDLMVNGVCVCVFEVEIMSSNAVWLA